MRWLQRRRLIKDLRATLSEVSDPTIYITTGRGGNDRETEDLMKLCRAIERATPEGDPARQEADRIRERVSPRETQIHRLVAITRAVLADLEGGRMSVRQDKPSFFKRLGSADTWKKVVGAIAFLAGVAGAVFAGIAAL